MLVQTVWERKQPYMKVKKNKKNDFDDMDQNSSQVKVARGGIVFLHRFGCQKEAALRDRISCRELTISNNCGLDTFFVKICWTSN